MLVCVAASAAVAFAFPQVRMSRSGHQTRFGGKTSHRSSFPNFTCTIETGSLTSSLSITHPLRGLFVICTIPPKSLSRRGTRTVGRPRQLCPGTTLLTVGGIWREKKQGILCLFVFSPFLSFVFATADDVLLLYARIPSPTETGWRM